MRGEIRTAERASRRSNRRAEEGVGVTDLIERIQDMVRPEMVTIDDINLPKASRRHHSGGIVLLNPSDFIVTEQFYERKEDGTGFREIAGNSKSPLQS